MPEASSAAESGRSPAQRNRLAVALAAASTLALGAWLADRLTHIYVTDARVSATMVALSARVPGWVREVPVEEGAEVPGGAALVQLDDEMAALIHAGLLRKVEALEAEHDSLARQRTMAERQTASRQAGQAAEPQGRRGQGPGPTLTTVSRRGPPSAGGAVARCWPFPPGL